MNFRNIFGLSPYILLIFSKNDDPGGRTSQPIAYPSLSILAGHAFGFGRGISESATTIARSTTRYVTLRFASGIDEVSRVSG